MSDSNGAPKSVQSFMCTEGGGGVHTHTHDRSCTEGGGAVHTRTHDASGLRVDDNICISDLEEGNQYKFLGVLGTVRQEERMSLKYTAK